MKTEFNSAKYIGQDAPTISGQEAIALEFNPRSGVVGIFYLQGKIDRIVEITEFPLEVWFDNQTERVRIYERFGPSKSPKYRLAWAK